MKIFFYLSHDEGGKNSNSRNKLKWALKKLVTAIVATLPCCLLKVDRL